MAKTRIVRWSDGTVREARCRDEDIRVIGPARMCINIPLWLPIWLAHEIVWELGQAFERIWRHCRDEFRDIRIIWRASC